MASATMFSSYQRLKHEEDHDQLQIAERLPVKSRLWSSLKRVPIKKRFRVNVKVPSSRKKVKLVRVSFGKLVERLKEGQDHFGHLFAGKYVHSRESYYMFILLTLLDVLGFGTVTFLL
ncbi:hypothetical protein V6N13_123498 [Hibiscus sabdariffa]|uniref:Uncharacterized protein n=1 Tax=Hibiscus sabdariffa TaxID=183260 RepID=A0ABR2QTQ4_9ROSI